MDTDISDERFGSTLRLKKKDIGLVLVLRWFLWVRYIFRLRVVCSV